VLRRETGAHRLTAFYTDNPNRLGYPAAYLLPFVLHLVFRRWRKGHRLQAVAGGTVACYLLGWALMASASRGGTVGLLVALPLFLIFRDGSRSPFRLGARIVTLVGAGVVVIMLILHTSLFPDTLRTRVTRTFGAEESLTQDRGRLADAGLKAFEESPFIGTGLDNFRYVARDYEDHVTDQAPHNLWIQFLAQIGVIGTAAFLCLLLIWFELHAKALGRIGRGEGYECIVAFMCSFAALMVILMTIPIMNQRHYWLLYALGLAFVTNYAGASTERTSDASHADHRD
jgi:O-antigen ligase